MARYARLENGLAVEVIETGDFDIAQLYAPSFVAEMVALADGVEVEIGAPLNEVQPPLTAPQPTLKTVAIQAAAVTGQAPVTVDQAWRQSSFAATEWQVSRHRDEQALGRGTTLTPQQYLELLQYRQALRDWPDAALYPAAESRPSAPQWIAVLPE